MVAYVPTRNSPTTVSLTGSLGSPVGSGPYTSIISNMQNTNFVLNQQITATAGSGNFGSGVVTVTGIIDSTSIGVSSTATFTSGTVYNVTGASPASPIIKTSNNSNLIEFRLVLGTQGV
jgi:hypothetical protein